MRAHTHATAGGGFTPDRRVRVALVHVAGQLQVRGFEELDHRLALACVGGVSPVLARMWRGEPRPGGDGASKGKPTPRNCGGGGAQS